MSLVLAPTRSVSLTLTGASGSVTVLPPSTPLALGLQHALRGLPGPAGSNATFPSRRHDCVGSTDYIGTAPSGSADASAVWTIKKIVVAANGTVTVTTATGEAWTGRLAAAYT